MEKLAPRLRLHAAEIDALSVAERRSMTNNMRIQILKESGRINLKNDNAIERFNNAVVCFEELCNTFCDDRCGATAFHRALEKVAHSCTQNESTEPNPSDISPLLTQPNATPPTSHQPRF